MSAGDYVYTGIQGQQALRRFAKSNGDWKNVAGSSASGYADGTGTDASFGALFGLDTDGTNLYVADEGKFTIRKLAPGAALPVTQSPAADVKVTLSYPVLSTVAGNSTSAAVDGTGSSASFNSASGLVIAGGYGYTFDSYRIRRITLATGVVTTVAGAGLNGCSDRQHTSLANIAGFSMATTDGKYLYWTDGCPGGNQPLSAYVIDNVRRFYGDGPVQLATASPVWPLPTTDSCTQRMETNFLRSIRLTALQVP